ncbi:MAG: O-antigen ligase family protein [Solirubrobacteraceae bacterium]
MLYPPEPHPHGHRRGVGIGAQQLAAISSFGGEEPLRLPFNIQRTHAFLFAVAIISVIAVAVGTGLQPVIGVGLVAGVAIAFAVALNDLVGLVLLATLAAATSGLAKGIPVPGMRLSQVLIGGVGVILLASARRYVRWSAFDWLALLYALGTLVIGAIDMLDQTQPFNQGTINLLLGPFQFLLLYRATVVTTRTTERRKLALRLMLCASVPVSLLAIGQQFNFPGVRSLIVTLTKNDVYAAGATARVTGPFPLWHNLGGYLFLLLLTMVALQLKGIKGVVSTRAMVFIAVVDVIALIETLDMAPVLGLVAGILIVGVWLGGFSRVLIGLAVVIAIALALFGGRVNGRVGAQFNRSPGAQRSALVPQTIQYRIDLWNQELIPLIKQRMATGYGPNLPPQLANFPYTESQYVNLLYRGGVILLGIWAVMFFAMGAAGVKSARRDSEPFQHALGAAVAVGVLCLFFMQSIEAYFVDDGTPQVLWMLVGLLSFHELGSRRVEAVKAPFEHALSRRAWASNVAMGMESLDPSTQELLRLIYTDRLPHGEVVSAMGLTSDAVERWRVSAIARLAQYCAMEPSAVERTLQAERSDLSGLVVSAAVPA